MATISQTTFADVNSWMKMCWFWLKFHWSLFPMVQLTILRQWLVAWSAPSHYLNQCWPNSWIHVWGTRGRLVNTLVWWKGDIFITVIWIPIADVNAVARITPHFRIFHQSISSCKSAIKSYFSHHSWLYSTMGNGNQRNVCGHVY